MTSHHKTGTHPFLWQAGIRPALIDFNIGMYIHTYTHIYVHIFTSQKECLHIFSHKPRNYLVVQVRFTNSTGPFLHRNSLWPGETFTIDRCIKLSSEQRCRNTWGAEAGPLRPCHFFFWIRPLNFLKKERMMSGIFCWFVDAFRFFFLGDPWKTLLRIWKSWQRKQAGSSALWLLSFSYSCCCALGTKQGLQFAQFACYLSQNFKPHLIAFLSAHLICGDLSFSTVGLDIDHATLWWCS